MFTHPDESLFQARWPLSYRHRFILRKPDHPKAVILRKFSSWSTRFAQKISRRSFEKLLWPFARKIMEGAN